MKIIQIPVGMLHTNCYLLGDEATGNCAVIDPGSNTEKILAEAEAAGLKIQQILLTHGHFDHVMAAPGVQKATGAKLYIHRDDALWLEPEEVRHRGYLREPYEKPRIDGFLENGQTVAVGGLTCRILHTPGHTLGSVTILCEDRMFSGDTLFYGCCGRCDLEGGSMEMMYHSLKKLAQLDGDYEVLPGHMETTRLSNERRYNPYMCEAMRR